MDKGPIREKFAEKDSKGPVTRKIENSWLTYTNGCVLDFRLMKD